MRMGLCDSGVVVPRYQRSDNTTLAQEMAHEHHEAHGASTVGQWATGAGKVAEGEGLLDDVRLRDERACRPGIIIIVRAEGVLQCSFW
jgi:hypothetical protein